MYNMYVFTFYLQNIQYYEVSLATVHISDKAMGDSLESVGLGKTVPDVLNAPVEKVINYIR